MKRRKFLTLTAAAPLVRLPAATAPANILDMPAILSPFCLTGGTPDFRPGLRQVFAIDGWRVASDGRVCVRGRDKRARRKDDKAPKAECLNWDGPWGNGFRIARFPAEGDWVECASCGHTGPYDYTGEPWWCCMCEAEGMTNYRDGDLPEEFRGLRLRLRYVELVMELPGVVWHLPLTIREPWPFPVHFKWRGGDGLLMPMTKREPPDMLLEAAWVTQPEENHVG